VGVEFEAAVTFDALYYLARSRPKLVPHKDRLLLAAPLLHQLACHKFSLKMEFLMSILISNRV